MITINNKRLYLVITLFFMVFTAFSQDSYEKENTFYSLEKAKKEPEKVKKLDLAMQHPKLKSIPKEIGLFPNLESLDVSYNRVGSISIEIKNCQKLKYLYLNENHYLTELPVVLKELKSLQVVEVKGIKNWGPEKKEAAKQLLPGVQVIVD